MMKSPSIFLIVIVLLGASTSANAAPKSAADETPLFYPPAPNAPRLQYLAKFSSAHDVSDGNKNFRNFIFGGDAAEGKVVGKPYGVAVHEGAIYVVVGRSN